MVRSMVAGPQPICGVVTSMRAASGRTNVPTMMPAPSKATTNKGVARFIEAASTSQDDLEVLALPHTRGVELSEQVRGKSLARDLALGVDLHPRREHEGPVVGARMRQG